MHGTLSFGGKLNEPGLELNIFSSRKTMFARFAIFLTFLLALTCLGGCGQKNEFDHDVPDNFAVKEAIVEALKTDEEIDKNARLKIVEVIEGKTTMQNALDYFVDLNREIISQIEKVMSPAKPPDKFLAKAQELTAEYLRNRVHQFEGCLLAKSADELKAAYESPLQPLETAKEEIIKQLVRYDPKIKI